jgi:hypothetical protein
VEDLLRPVVGGLSQLEWMFLLQAKGELYKPEKFRLLWLSLRDSQRQMIAEEQVEELLNRFDKKLQLGRNLCAALKHLVLDCQRRDACDWLRNGELPDAARESLGMAPVPRDDDVEEESLAVIRALARLAAPHLPIVICFDQIEALQAHPGDLASLFAFGRLVSGLHDQAPNLLLVTCIQSTFNDMLLRGVREADMDRLAEEAALLKRPTWDEAEELIVRRLDSLGAVATARQRHSAPLWPLPSNTLRELIEKQGYTPRRLIAWCKAEFERLQTGEIAPPPPLEEFLKEEFQRRLREVVSGWTEQTTDETIMHGLPWAWSAGGWGAAAANAAWEEVDLVLEGAAEQIPLSVCNVHVNRLTHRLERLRRQVEQGELDNLVLVRDADRPFSAAATKAQEHLHSLQQAGAVMVRPSLAALQHLETVRRIVSSALTGDLTNAGEVVTGEQVQAWLAVNLAAGLRDFLDDAARTEERQRAAETATPAGS